MIDEFQDTSKLQSGIVNLIQNNNLFLVGDIKQSIYMFNSAKPEIFKNYLEDDNFSKLLFLIILDRYIMWCTLIIVSIRGCFVLNLSIN